MNCERVIEAADRKSGALRFPTKSCSHIFSQGEAFGGQHENEFDIVGIRVDDHTHITPLLDWLENVHVLFRAKCSLEKVEDLTIHHGIVVEKVHFFDKDQIATLNITLDNSWECNKLTCVAPPSSIEAVTHNFFSFYLIITIVN